jgi:NAD(P)-dependent dehydrogenase (short-subunit alcohol dehydrogenase family)
VSDPLAQFSLAGKVALITGASRGIGAALAQAYAAAGARVVLSSRKQAGVEEVAEAIHSTGGEALALAAHTGDAGAVTALVEQAVARFGGLDILVNNAATNPHFGPLLEAEESHWDKTLDVNVKGYMRLVRACVPQLRARGGGKIVNVASIAGLHPQTDMGVYCVSKAAVLMLTQVLAVELAQDNIQVNALAPGYVKTHFSQALWDNPALNEALLRQIPQGRLAAPAELTGIALYLASAASSFTTGAVFVVDGGHLVG